MRSCVTRYARLCWLLNNLSPLLMNPLNQVPLPDLSLTPEQQETQTQVRLIRIEDRLSALNMSILGITNSLVNLSTQIATFTTSLEILKQQQIEQHMSAMRNAEHKFISSQNLVFWVVALMAIGSSLFVTFHH